MLVQPLSQPPLSRDVAPALAPAETPSLFDALLDVINPLQHLPLVGPLYRSITGDGIDVPARLAGGALFGGVTGFFGALGGALYEQVAGESLEASALSLFGLGPAPASAPGAYAQAQMLSPDEIERRPIPAGRLLTIEA
jgi:hypothetical protein